MVNKRLIALACSSSAALIFTIMAGFMAGILTVGQAWTLSKSVDDVFLGGLTLSEISGTLQLWLLIVLGRALMVWLGEISAGILARYVKTALRERLYRQLINLGPNYVRGERTGELINTMVEGIGALDAWFRGYLPQLVLAALLPLTFLFFIFPRDLLTGFVLLLTAPLIPIFMYLIGSLADELTKKQWKTLSHMSAHFLDVLQGLTTLKYLGRSREQIDIIAKVSTEFRKTTLGVLRVAFLSAFVLEIVATLSTAVVAVEIGLRLLYGHMVFSDAFFVLLLAPEFYLPLRMLGTRFHAGVEGVAAAQRIFEVLDSGPEIAKLKCAPLLSHPLTAVSFNNISYIYPDERVALQEVTFTIEAGQKIALVGPSGAGKSTIAHLILGFMQPTEGSISWPVPSGIQTAWLSQRPYLFNDTIAANIRLARPDASMDDVVRAAKAACAHDFITKIGSGYVPKTSDDKYITYIGENLFVPLSDGQSSKSQQLYGGYETIIGERGMRLSGGQAQRIALARAFLMEAPFVILDEPTSYLDPELESQIQDSINQLLGNRTALIIAHRLSTIMQADKIFVLEDGRIVERGTHDDLLANCGLYAQMVREMEVTSGRLKIFSNLTPILYNQLPTFNAQHETQTPDTTLLKPSAVLSRLFSLLSGSWNWIALAVLLGFATIASSISLLGSSAYIISAAALQPSIAELQLAIVGVRFFGISRGVFRYFERLTSHQVTFHLLARLRVWFYEKLEPLAPARLQSFRSGDLLSRVVADIGSLENFYIRALAPPFVAICVALLSGGLLARYDYRLAVTLWIFLALAGVVLPWLAHYLARGVGRDIVSARSALNVALLDGVQGLPDLLAFGRADEQARIVNVLGSDLSQADKRSTLIGGLRAALMMLFSNLGMGAVFVLAVPLVSTGQLDGVYLATIALIALSAFEAVLPLPGAAQYLEENTEAARRLFEIVDAQPEVCDRATPLPPPQKYDLEIKNLSFSYPDLRSATEQTAILNQVSLSLPQGKSLALLGPSGAGKSTLMQLMLRFWEFENGEILLGGRDLRCYRQEHVRAIFGVVSQETHLFNASVRENLLLARPDASHDAIARAASQAQINSWIESLPQGYETQIGEGGLNLSGGERQRLSLARALLKQAPVLLLDEPTAHLDPINAGMFMHSLRESRGGRSLILITHQDSDLDWVDEIIYLRDGCISAQS